MRRATCILAILAFAVPALADDSGRTDGPEGSEYGKGGYRYWSTGGAYFVEGFVGAAVVDIEFDDSDREVSRTDLFSGVNAGYMVEDWLAFQLGFGHISEQKTNLLSAGMRSSYDLDPFSYSFSLDTELYSPDVGSTKFGIAPGVGAEMHLSERLHVGLRFQHDFIFADDNISINRFSGKIQFQF
jgi:hypothetical protein